MENKTAESPQEVLNRLYNTDEHKMADLPYHNTLDLVLDAMESYAQQQLKAKQDEIDQLQASLLDVTSTQQKEIDGLRNEIRTHEERRIWNHDTFESQSARIKMLEEVLEAQDNAYQWWHDNNIGLLVNADYEHWDKIKSLLTPHTEAKDGV